MSKVEAVCPYCKTPNAVEKTLDVDCFGLENIKCSHCSKSWKENLTAIGILAKSAPAPSSELAALRVQLRAQMDELLRKINGLLQQRETASRRFQPNGVEKDGVVQQELTKALANGKPVTFQPEGTTSARFQTVESVGSCQRVRSGGAFDTNGVEKSEVADQELRQALTNGKPMGFIPRGN